MTEPCLRVVSRPLELPLVQRDSVAGLRVDVQRGGCCYWLSLRCLWSSKQRSHDREFDGLLPPGSLGGCARFLVAPPPDFEKVRSLPGPIGWNWVWRNL